jgi:hypothetical protein
MFLHYVSQWGGWICLWINIIFHCNNSIEKHNAETFKIKKLKFCEKESVLGYTTVNYKFKPLDDILVGSVDFSNKCDYLDICENKYTY